MNQSKSSFQIWTDGGSRGNPGPAAIGFVIKSGDKIIYKHSEYIGKATNNIAEYQAVLSALKWLSQHKSNEPIIQISYYVDSLLVAKQLSGSFKIKNATLFQIASQIMEIQAQNHYPITYTHIPREQNTLADALVNQALDANT